MGKIIFEPETTHTISMDLEMLNTVAKNWDNQWMQMKRGNLQVDLKVFYTPQMEISRIVYSNAVYIKGSHPPGTVSISLVRTRGLVYQQNQSLEPYELIVYTDGDELDYLANEKSQIFTIVVETHFFSQSFFHYFGRPFDEIRGKKLALKEEFVTLFILQIERWLKYFENPHYRKLEPEQFYAIEQDILGQLFSLIRTTEPAPRKEKFDFGKVREVLHENIDNIYTISDLLRELNISARTLQYHFKQKLGLTPKQYLQYLRLNTIRHELLRANAQRCSVSDVALKYGFFHSSHFSSEYKKLFGETPSQTLSSRGKL